jgi:septation ring formation regulator EzrA
MENLGDENRNELNAIVSVLGDVLVEIKEMRGAFDRTFTLVLDKLDGIRSDLKDVKEEIKDVKEEVKHIRSDLSKMADHEERLKALEMVVFRRGT